MKLLLVCRFLLSNRLIVDVQLLILLKLATGVDLVHVVVLLFAEDALLVVALFNIEQFYLVLPIVLALVLLSHFVIFVLFFHRFVMSVIAAVYLRTLQL